MVSWGSEPYGSRTLGDNVRNVVTVAVLLVTMFGAGGWTRAQVGALEFGPAPGDAFIWPEARDLFTGQLVELSPPSVVIVSRLSPCSNCELPLALAKSWGQRYGSVQAILLTRDTGDQEAMRRELAPLVDGQTIVADDGAIAGTLGFSAQPITYVVSADARVRFRQTGFEIRRLTALDAIVELANSGRWQEIDALTASGRGDEGNQVPAAWGLEAGNGPIVAIVHSAGCIHCRRLADQGMDLILNDFARRYPDARFVVLRESEATDYASQLSQFVEVYGEGTRDLLTRAIEEAPVQQGAQDALSTDDLSENVAVVDFVPGQAGDPMFLSGVGVVPNILVFDSDGRFIGPEPYWLGPYDAGGLINYLQEALSGT